MNSVGMQTIGAAARMQTGVAGLLTQGNAPGSGNPFDALMALAIGQPALSDAATDAVASGVQNAVVQTGPDSGLTEHVNRLLQSLEDKPRVRALLAELGEKLAAAADGGRLNGLSPQLRSVLTRVLNALQGAGPAADGAPIAEAGVDDEVPSAEESADDPDNADELSAQAAAVIAAFLSNAFEHVLPVSRVTETGVKPEGGSAALGNPAHVQALLPLQSNETQPVRQWNLHELTLALRAALSEVVSTEPAEGGAAGPAGSHSTGKVAAESAGLSAMSAMSGGGTHLLAQLAGGALRAGGRGGADHAQTSFRYFAGLQRWSSNAGKTQAGTEGVAAASVAILNQEQQAIGDDAGGGTGMLQVFAPAGPQDSEKDAPGETGVERIEFGTPAGDPARTGITQGAAAPTATAGADPTRRLDVIDQVRRMTEMMVSRTDGLVQAVDGRMEATLRLKPAELGDVRVELVMQADRTVQAQFVAQRPETAALLTRSTQQLGDALARQGLVVDRVQVAVQATGASGQGQPGGFGGGEREAPAREQVWNHQQRQQQFGEQRRERRQFGAFEQA